MSITPTSFERLFVSDFQAAEPLAKENPLGIRTVLSVCTERIQLRSREIIYIQIPVLDAQPLPFEDVDQVIDAIARTIVAGQVLIHCVAGLSRSPVMAALYFDLVGYRSFDAGLQESARLRPIDPAPVIVRTAREYLKRRVQEVQ